MSRFRMFPKSQRPMSCRRVAEVLQGYLDGEVDDLTSVRIARHLEACRRCGMELAVYQEIKASLRRSERGVDDDAVERLRSFGARLLSEDDAGDPGEREDRPGG